ncbi:MAG: sigma-70 family RNA polymerase sigma factor [Clostridia bacterium]|nr:sigma-70 family RNA polymerase sigma factor [Clostridia bacterium]
MARKVSICGIDTNELPKLTQKESSEYLKRIKEGDKAARETFLLANMRLVLSMVHRFPNANADPDDLFQVGCLGLVKALNNFDLRHGVLFSTYAVPMILGEIRRYIRESNGIKVSRAMRDVAYKAMQARESLEKKNVADPSLFEIAEEMDVPIKEVVCALDAIATPLSLYEPISGGDPDSLLVMDGIVGEKNPEDGWTERLDLKKAISKLPKNEKEVIYLRYFVGKTQTEVSKLSHISQAQVSRLENNAIKRIKEELSV